MTSDLIAVIPIEVILDKRLTLEQTRVLVALFSFRNKVTNTVWPSRKAISERTGMHPSNISAATTSLSALGWLTKEGLGGFSKSSHYTLAMPDILAPSVAQKTTVACSTTVAQSATRTEQSIEQSIEQSKKKSATAPTRRPAKAGFPIPEGIDARKWADWMQVRKAKRAPMTETAWGRHLREAEKAGITPNAAVVACAEYNWQGFDAQWYAKRQSKQVLAESGQRPAPRTATPAETFRERDARLQREEWERSTGTPWPEQDLPASARRQPAPAPYTLEAETRRIS